MQAFVDKKKVVVTEATIREALYLDDAKGVECLPNEEIFAEKQVGDLSTHITKYTSSALTQKVFTNMQRVGKGFFGVGPPLFEGMLVEQQVVEEGDAEVHGEEVNVGDAAARDVSVAHREVPTVAEEPSIPSPTPPTLPPQPSQDIPSTSRVGKGFSGVETPLFKGMIVEQQVAEGADKVHDEGVPAIGVAAEGVVSAADDVVPTAEDEPSTPPPQQSQDQHSTSQKMNDFTRLHALVDKKKVVITEASTRDALRLDDAEGVECLPNEEIFTELVRMGYEKPSTKLTFYKAFFLSRWKFLIHTILQYMSAK
nr:hypothetical protein [Tanacetum cinerariifolium]